MRVSHSDVERVARLARLRLEPEELDRLRLQLNDILDHVTELSALDLDDVPAFSHAVDAGGVEAAVGLRGDGGVPDALTSTLAELGTAVEDGFFTVPRLHALQQTAGDERD